MHVLLVRAGALGDLLLLRRTIASLKLAGHRVTLLAPAGPGAALVGPGPANVDRLLAWDEAPIARLMTDGGLAEGPLRDELEGVDAVLAYTRDSTLIRNLESITGRVIAVDPRPAPGSGHASEWLVRPLGTLGVTIVDPVPTESPSVEEADPNALSLGARFLAVHPGSGSPVKNWPPRLWADLINRERIAGRARGPWLLVLGPAEGKDAADLGGLQPAAIARNWAPRRLGALLSRGTVFVGNDSGVSHLAAAWGAPTVVLFGPTDPNVWSPIGPHVRVVRSPTGRMEDIAVEDVLAQVNAFTKEQGTRTTE